MGKIYDQGWTISDQNLNVNLIICANELVQDDLNATIITSYSELDSSARGRSCARERAQE